MQPNDNHFPPELLQWVESTPYAALSPQQQNILANYCTQAEYTAMQQSYQLLAALSPQPQPKIKPLHKQQLLAQYAATYAPKPSIALSLWRAAAVILFFISLGLGYLYSSHKSSTTSIVKTNIIRDTLYLSRQIATVSTTIHDTIYQRVAPKTATSNAYLASPKAPKTKATTTSNPDQLHIVAVQSINQTANLSRHSSIKNDKIIQEFQFVSL